MATRIIKEEDKLLTVEFNNGDLEALRKIKVKWKFKDLESALRFGLAVLTIAAKDKIYHEKENGLSERIEPTHHLMERFSKLRNWSSPQNIIEGLRWV